MANENKTPPSGDYSEAGWLDADWDRAGGLLPAVIQDVRTGQILMLGYMSREAAKTTLESGHVTFYSRSKQRLWTKGETSGNTLGFVSAARHCSPNSCRRHGHRCWR